VPAEHIVGVTAADLARVSTPAVRPHPRLDAWRGWLAGAAAWTVLALLSVTQGVLRLASRGEPAAWGRELAFGLLDWYSCALFLPPLWWLVRRAPLERGAWARRLPAYAAATLAAAVAKYALLVPLVRVLFGEAGSLGAVLAGSVLTEVMILAAAVGVMHAVAFARRARDREALALRLRAQLGEAQLGALRAQLHPHFLFNTLNAAVALVHRDPDAADLMLTRLAELLRLTLRADAGHETTLGEELAVLDRYVAIMRARFGDRLDVRVHVAPALAGAPVPAFVLQPLVENALEHGVARLDGPGRVEVAARRDGAALVLTVRDNGPGPRERVVDGEDRAGVGLRNTRDRLAQLYGDAAGLSLRALAGGGAEAELRLPLRASPAPA
jgi:signal transduction histidine kinase